MTQVPRRGFALVPILLFAGLALVFWKGLSGNPSELPSALIGKPAPEFSLGSIAGSDIPPLSSKDLGQGNVSIINIWASWCGPCRLEHPILMELAKRSDIKLFGINTKDSAENARRFLGTLGQPFARIGADENGRVTIDWGSYGVPETFVVDGRGIIRFKWIGPLSPEIVSGVLAEQIEKAKQPL